MSIEVINRVWEKSTHGGPQLLLLLALADHADIDGVCWPGHPKLAKKTRVTPRQAIRLSKQLEDSGEIFILKGGGRSISNSYLITIGLTEDEIQTRLVKHPRFGLSVQEAAIATKEIMSRLTPNTSPENSDTDVTFSTRKGDTHVMFYNEENSDMQDINSDMQGQKTVTHMSPEPSCNHHNNHQLKEEVEINFNLSPYSHLSLEDQTVYYRESEDGELMQAVVKSVTAKRLRLNIGGEVRLVNPEGHVFFLNGGPDLAPVVIGEAESEPTLAPKVLELKNKLIDLTGAANIPVTGPRINAIKRCQEAAIYYTDKEITAQDIQCHYDWFREEYWRGKQGDPYTLEMLWSTWKSFIEWQRNGGKNGPGKGQSRTNGNTQAGRYKSNGIPALEAHSRYEKRANITTGETYWYDSETGERLSNPPPGVS